MRVRRAASLVLLLSPGPHNSASLALILTRYSASQLHVRRKHSALSAGRNRKAPLIQNSELLTLSFEGHTNYKHNLKLVLDHSNIEIVGSNPARRMDLCSPYYVLYCPV